DSRRMRVSIPLKNLRSGTFEGQSWVVDRFPSDVTAEASHTALFDFLVSPMDARKRAILGTPDADVTAAELDAPPPAQAKSLNASQRAAVHRAVHCGVFHLIWGPPGTGKTRIIPEIIDGVAGRVLLGAFTNTAVDKMLIALLDRDPEARFLRFGR